MAIQLIVTNQGRAALINAANNGTNAVLINSLGLSNQSPNVSASSTNLAGEIKRIENISGEAVEDDLIHLSFIDTSNDTFSIKSLAVYLNNGVLFAIGKSDTTIAEKVSGSDLVFSVDIKLTEFTSGQIQFGNTNVSIPPATQIKAGVMAIATNPEARAGTNNNKAIVPSALKDYIDFRIQEGINAALLGGLPPSHYTNIIARLGFTPANITALNGMWTAFNDGAGSGLDADVFHGHEFEDFALKDEFENNKATNGYTRLSGGIILQWCEGLSISSGDNAQFVGFPIQFPNECLNCTVSTSISSNTDSDPYFQIIGAPTAAGVNIKRQIVSGMRDWAASKPIIFAIGH